MTNEMTRVLDSPTDPAPPFAAEVERLTRPRRVWTEHRARLVGSTFAVALLLTATGLLVGIKGVVSADEGAVLAQVDVLQRTGGYGMKYWAADADPTGRWFPFHLAERHGDQWFLFTKKPAYVEIVSLADRVAGRWGILVLHASSVALAALAAAAVAGRLRGRNTQRVQVATLWITAIGSPMVMDGAWVIAHGPAAAAAGLTAVGVASWWDERRRRGLLCVALGLFVGVLLRNEAVLLGGAIALVGLFAVTPIPRADPGVLRRPVHARQGWQRGAWLTVTAGGATAMGMVVATAWQRAAEGGSSSGAFRVRDQVGWVEARVLALWNVLISPGSQDGASRWLVLAATLAVAVAWSPPVRRRANGRATVALTAAAVAGLLLSLMIDAIFVPGVLAAFPVGVAALAVAWPHRQRLFGRGLAAILTFVWLTFGAAVLLTTYAAGGTGDWGGRYLHLGLPFITPVIAFVLCSAVDRQPSLRRATQLLGVAALTMALIGHGAFHRSSSNHATLREIVAWLAPVTATAHVAHCWDGAIVVTTSPLLARVAYDGRRSTRYLFIDPTDDIRAEAAAIGRAWPLAQYAVIAPKDDAVKIRAGLPNGALPPARSPVAKQMAPRWSYPEQCLLGRGI